MNISFATAAYPPDLDGIGDHSWWLAGTLAREGSYAITVLTRQGPVTVQPGVHVDPIFDPANLATVRNLPAALELGRLTTPGSWLVFQYNPFSWGRRGWCPNVPQALAGIRRLSPSLGLAVIFHETTVPRWPLRFAAMRLWQRRFFRATCRLADVTFASTGRYQRQVRAAGSRSEPILLPVGSNLSRSSLSHEAARRELGLSTKEVVVGVFGSAHMSRRLDWIAAAFRALCARFSNVKLLYLGPDGRAIGNALGGREFLIDLGVCSAQKAGACFTGMDLLLAPFVDGMSTRRGSAIAALQNGVPLATNVTEWTDGVFAGSGLRGLLLSRATDAREFASDVAAWSSFLTAPEALPALRLEVREFHDRFFAWPVIAHSLQNTLGNFSGGRRSPVSAK